MLGLLDLVERADTPAHILAYGEKRRLEIGMALATSPNVLLLDEPLAGMSPAERAATCAFVRDIARSRTIVIVEHDLDAIFGLAERITVLYEGRAAGGRPGRRNSPQPAGSGRLSWRSFTSPMSLLEVDSINTLYGDSHVLFDLSLRVEQGEVVALLGRNGAGKTTTLRSIMGVLAPKRGDIRLDGQPIGGLPPSAIAGLGVQLVPEERAIFGSLTVEENLRIAALTAPDAWSSSGSMSCFRG